jgi:oligopeptidase B
MVGPATANVTAPPGGPPHAPRRRHVLRAHGEARRDDWYWLRDLDDPAVIAHLQAERSYAQARIALVAPLVRELELALGEDVESDASAGKLGIDMSADAGDGGYFTLGDVVPTPARTALAYSFDRTGREAFTLRLVRLPGHARLCRDIYPVGRGATWNRAGSTLYYLRLDARLRPFELRRRSLSGHDDAVVVESDIERKLVLAPTTSGRYLQVRSERGVECELMLIDLAATDPQPRLIVGRAEHRRCHADHHDSRLLMLVDDIATGELQLVQRAAADARAEPWRVLVPPQPGVALSDLTAGPASAAVIETSADGSRVLVVDSDDRIHRIEPAHPLCRLSGLKLDQDGTLRIRHESPARPPRESTYRLSAVAAGLYRSRSQTTGPSEPFRVYARASDGAAIPITVLQDAVRHRDPQGLVLSVYGAYGSIRGLEFAPRTRALVRRGVAVAFAHVRGGGELGARWHYAGRGRDKGTTFSDLLACAEHLIGVGLPGAGGIVLRGESAGGLAVAAALNLRPTLFSAAVLEVPFVDCLTTLLDHGLPLSCEERDEWGNPEDCESYAWIRSYSPYDNIAAQSYPRLLVTGALHDAQVPVWEPAKWVQKLRAAAPGANDVLFLADLDCGHLGPASPPARVARESLILAFILHSMGLAGAEK